MIGWSFTPCFAVEGAARPNVVILIADDLGWADVGYHDSEIQTPGIDRLVREGLELDRFYAYPVCSPTRVGLLTGRSPSRLGINGPLSPSDKGIPVDQTLLSNIFKGAGYQTWLVGKWHVGAVAAESRPTQRGFDHFYGFLNGGIDYYKHTEFKSGTPDWHRNDKAVEEQGYSTDLLAAEAVRLISAYDGKSPFLLYLSFNAPHTPLQAPGSLVQKYGSIADTDRRTFAAMVDAMDRGIVDVLAALGRRNLDKNTVILFFSDNGGSTRAASSNKPLRMGKGSVYEGGIRVPAALWYPGVIVPGKKTSQVITVLDLLPTLCAAAGIDLPESIKPDGRNMWPVLTGAGNVATRPIVIANRRQVAVVDGNWKLVQGVRSRPRGAAGELYRLDHDPTESKNVASQHPDVIKRLQAAAAQTLERLADQPRGRRN